MPVGHEIRDVSQLYDLRHHAFMQPQGPHMPITEGYVAIPPALWIRDEEGALWTLGFARDDIALRSGKLEVFDVVRNGAKTGEYASRIEYRNNADGRKAVRIWCEDGKWKYWRNGRFV